MSTSPGTAPRPRRRWIWVTVALATALVLAGPVALRFWLKGDIQHRADPLQVYRRPVRALQITAPGDSVTVRPGGSRQVTIASTVSWVFGKPDISEIWHGQTLAVTVRCPSPNPFEDCSASLALEVPAGVRVEAAVTSGSATVTGISAPVRVTTTSGTVVLGYLSGPVRATATSGSISALSGLTSPRLTATVGSGSLALRFDAAPTMLTLAVGSGSGQVTVPPGTRYRLADGLAGRRVGNLSIVPGLAAPGSARLITARVGDGALGIGYAAGPLAGQ